VINSEIGIQVNQNDQQPSRNGRAFWQMDLGGAREV
jgi:hypothetical protein